MGTSQYTCTRTTEAEFQSATATAMEDAEVTAATREQLNMSANGCLVPPCVTNGELCDSGDPSCSVSPFSEPENMKTGAIVGFCILGAAVVIGLVVFVYQTKINKMNKVAKQKFAGRLRESSRDFMKGDSGHRQKRTDLMDIFDHIDDDGDGVMTKTELWTYVTSKETSMSESEFNALFKQIDTDGSGMIDFVEFVTFMGKIDPSN